MQTNSLDVKVFDSIEEAPNYNEINKENQGEFKPINLKAAYIVRNGTAGGRSTVDFILEDENGQKYETMITGRLLRSVATIIGEE